MQVESQVIRILAEQAMVKPNSIGSDTEIERLDLDSLAMVDVLYSLEEVFDITIPYSVDDPAASDFKLTNVGEVARGVERLIAQRDATE